MICGNLTEDYNIFNTASSDLFIRLIFADTIKRYLCALHCIGKIDAFFISNKDLNFHKIINCAANPFRLITRATFLCDARFLPPPIEFHLSATEEA